MFWIKKQWAGFIHFLVCSHNDSLSQNQKSQMITFQLGSHSTAEPK
jgi:hypothetical protein